jgi:hypothetical protein
MSSGSHRRSVDALSQLESRIVARVINPGTLPVANAREDLAVSNIAVFVVAVRARGGQLAGAPARRAVADRDGRYGFLVTGANGASAQILMPGAPLSSVRDDLTATAPCIIVNDNAWWWNDAAGQVAGVTSPDGTCPSPAGPAR